MPELQMKQACMRILIKGTCQLTDPISPYKSKPLTLAYLDIERLAGIA